MPRAPAFKIDSVADLLRQLEYAPAETRKRQMDAAETLAGEIDPDRAYPREFVIYRITGYRPERDDMVTFAGAALRADLANLVQRLSDTLTLPEQRNEHPAMTLTAVARSLGVSAKTVQRYRREGLVCHMVMSSDGRKKLACYADALARFASARGERLERAARFTRISPETESLIISEARRMRESKPLSLNEAAKLISRRHGRAHETIRQMLLRHDRDASTPIFAGDREAIDAREIRIMHRAWIRGVDLGLIARRFDRSRPAILRAINRRRAELLRGLRIHAVELPTFAMDGAGTVILSAPAATQDLLTLPPHDEAFKLLEWAAHAQPLDESMEDAMLGAWNFLKRRAAMGIAALPRDEAPTSESLDAIETDLRWATRLHRRLTLLAMPAAIRRIELNFGRNLVAQPAEQILTLIRAAAMVIREALEDVDPSRGQRVERIVSFAMERELAQRSLPVAVAPRASARHAQGAAIALRGVFDELDEWETWLEPWRNMRGALERLPEQQRIMLTLRFGWDGRPPRTMREIAAGGVHRVDHRLPVNARRIQIAIRMLREEWRRTSK